LFFYSVSAGKEQLEGLARMKTNVVFKRAYNDSLARLEEHAIGAEIGSEPAWAKALGVSRTTVRAVFRTLATAGLIGAEGRRKVLIRSPKPTERYPEGETRPVRLIVEKRFMQWVLNGDLKPGQQINGLDLARQFGVSTSAIRNYLSGFSQFGLIDKRPNGGWLFKGFTRDFAEELCEVRLMFELRSAERFLALPSDDLAWPKLESIRQEHLDLLVEAQTRFTDFSELDERFHRLVNDASRNRFIVSFYDIISMIFHYHYQWNKRNEQQRNIDAMREHLVYIEALKSRNRGKVAAAIKMHLAGGRAGSRRLFGAVDFFPFSD
jgi:DNA-binding GntR family transcriptional regulator